MPDYVIIGAGITGLTCGYELMKRGADVLVLEASSSVGGKISTDRDSGYLLESGPNSLRVDSDAIEQLLNELGLAERILHASPHAQKRFILRNGQWVQVPNSPSTAIATPLFSFGGKLRILAEPFIKPDALDDESIQSFITRRLGREVFQYAADPFVTGIYAGDTSRLSMRHTFPSMWRAEHEAGSLVKSMMNARKAKTKRRKTEIISFPNGLAELTGALRAKLGARLKTSDNAFTITRSAEHYQITTPTETLETARVICASPAYQTAEQLRPLSPDVGQILTSIEYPPIAVLYLGYRIDQFKKPIEGFGGLIPSVENREILGVIYSSSNFAGRAPEGHLLLTVLIGGARKPEVADWTNDHAISVGEAEVTRLMHPNGPPTFRRARIWKRAIPQYTLGYQKILDGIDEFERANPGIHIIGNYRGGIAMSSCIRTATSLAERLVPSPVSH